MKMSMHRVKYSFRGDKQFVSVEKVSQLSPSIQSWFGVAFPKQSRLLNESAVKGGVTCEWHPSIEVLSRTTMEIGPELCGVEPTCKSCCFYRQQN